MVVVSRVVSGGQSGVDIAALVVAKRLKIRTGGTMPAGWRTQSGPRPQYAREYGMTEHSSSEYPPRTIENVKAADVTVRIALDFESPGERLTERACRDLARPMVDIPVRRGLGVLTFVADEQDIFDAARLIQSVAKRLGHPVTINFAGNSERTAPGIGVFAQKVIKMLLEACEEV